MVTQADGVASSGGHGGGGGGIGARAAVAPFLVGTAVGGVAGAVAGTLLSAKTRRLLIGMIQLVDRRLSRAERESLRFELLLQ